MEDNGDKPKPQRFMDVIRDLRRRDPFVPFRIVMTSGDAYVVENPDAMAMNDAHVFYCFPKTDRLAYLRISEIIAVETMEWKPAA